MGNYRAARLFDVWRTAAEDIDPLIALQTMWLAFNPPNTLPALRLA